MVAKYPLLHDPLRCTGSAKVLRRLCHGSREGPPVAIVLLSSGCFVFAAHSPYLSEPE